MSKHTPEADYVRSLIQRLPNARRTPASGAKTGFGTDILLTPSNSVRLAIEVKDETLCTKPQTRMLEKAIAEGLAQGRGGILLGADVCIMPVATFENIMCEIAHLTQLINKASDTIKACLALHGGETNEG